jgi:SAM-dependent methyltransferase
MAEPAQTRKSGTAAKGPGLMGSLARAVAKVFSSNPRSANPADFSLPLPGDAPSSPGDSQSAYLKLRSANNSLWADQAKRYGSELAATASSPWVRNASLRRLKQLIRRNDFVLEVGCGNASSLLGPLSHRCRAYGLDVTEEMLAIAKRCQRDIRGLVRSDVCSVPFLEATFDVVYSSRCLINVLDPKMQEQAIREIFRVVKPNGRVILIENFREPLDRVNRARARFRSGSPVVDAHNLQLDLEKTLRLANELGWEPVVIRGNTLGSFVSHVLVARLFPRRGASLAERLLYPVYVGLTHLDDVFGKRLPLFGKDIMLLLERRRTDPSSS